MAPKVTVFIDYQNAHLSGHETWCPITEPVHYCLIHPLRLAESLVKKRAPGGIVTSVRVYRGRPDPRMDPISTGRSDRQAVAWTTDPRVEMFRRPLRYPRDWGKPGCVEKEREKGIDVAIAVDLVRMGMRKEYEVAILFSRDQDLLPALEVAVDLPDVHVEVATWEGTSKLFLKYRDLHCHKLDETVFAAVRDPTIY